jgi:sporulation protein YlmC with PRC-barrel domain
MRLSDLNDKRVRTLDGKRLGRVHDVHCRDGKITELKVGPASFIERMTARDHGGRIAWESVRKVEHDRIVVDVDPAPGKKR